MDWEPSGQVMDRLTVPSIHKMRSLSTSTPVISEQTNSRLFRSHSVSACSSNDSGFGESLLNVSGVDSFDTPDFSHVESYSNCADTIKTASACPTPKVALFDTTLCGRRQLDFSFSPVVFKPKNTPARRSVDTDFEFEDGHNDTFTEESAQYLSQLNLDSGCEISMSNNVSDIVIPKLNLDIDNDSPMPDITVTKMKLKPECSPCVGTAKSSTPSLEPPIFTQSKEKVTISPEFEAFLNQFLPEERDRLIGRQMGRDYVDILEELHIRGMARILSTIFGYLDLSDLNSVNKVSARWRGILSSDKQAYKRRRDYLKLKRKPEFHGKENLRKKSPSPSSRNVTGAGPLQALGNLQLQNSTAAMVTPDTHKTRLDLFVEAAKELRSDERLQKCPRCRKPAKVLPVQERGICLQSDCAFDYCINCYNKFHRSLPCAPIRSPQKRAKTETVGHKKSKKNLKRL